MDDGRQDQNRDREEGAGREPEEQPESERGALQRTPEQVQSGTGVSGALESTLENLSRSIERMESIISQLQTGEADWDESVKLISEANDLAMASAQSLDRVVQDVVYGAGRRHGDDEDEDEAGDGQQPLELS